MKEGGSNQPKQTIWHPNRNYLNLNNNIIVDSCFPGGNLSSASITGGNPLTIQIQGNTDVSNDCNAKYWLYFRIRGFRRDRPLRFILKNANHLRKYYNQTRYRPYIIFKEGEEQWQSNSTPIDITILENGHYQGTFVFQSQKISKISRSNRSTNDLYPSKEQKMLTSTATGKEQSRGDCYFAVTQPYTYQDLTYFIQNIKLRYRENNSSKVYFHQQTITYSYHRRKVQLVTITSVNNIESVSEKEPSISQEIFPSPKERPHKLKNNPVILVTARVHPSETSSSFFAQGLIQYLLGESKGASILRQLFIIQVIPMLNPDGVEHGNFRFDHELRNLNRYYGQSSIDKTPSIRAAQLLIEYYKNRNNEQCQFTQFYQQTYSRMFMYIDVHGHSSAMPSFLYGNHTDRMQYLIQNKMFCKLIEGNFVNGGFSKIQSEFSKKNMTVQQKYDQFSKLCAGRVFAGRADQPQQSVFHSYTLEILPYWQEYPKRKGDNKEKISATQYAKMLGRDVMISLLDLLDLNPESRFSDTDLQKMRKNIAKQCYNQQIRKLFLFKRAEGMAERNSYSEISKNRQNIAEKQYPYHNQYILRWFNNQIYLKHLMQKTFLLRQPKCLRFYQKIAKLMQFPGKQLLESPRKQMKQAKSRHNDIQIKPPEMKARLCQSSSKAEEDVSPVTIQNSKCFITREQKRVIGNEDRLTMVNRMKQKKEIKAITKQTLELRQQFPEFMPKSKLLEKDGGMAGNKISKRQFSIKKEGKKQTIDSTDRYEKQIVHKIYTESGQKNNNLFQIKIKEIRPKPKSNVRLQTQNGAEPISATSGTDKIKNSNSQAAHFCIGKTSDNKDEGKIIQRPSFIEEFIMKIRQERQTMITGKDSSKCVHKDEVRHKIFKYRPSLKDQLEEPEKSLLPVLRRNKIFTIASQSAPKETPQKGKGYDSVFQNKKRATTIESESNIDQLPPKTKKMMTIAKIEEKFREAPLKKSQKLTQFALL